MIKRKRKDTTLDDDCDEDNNAPISVDRNHIFFYCDVNTKNCLELNKNIIAVSNKLLALKNQYSGPEDDEANESMVVKLHINSLGGAIFDAMSTIDTILNCPVPVYTYIEGCAASAATLISVVGEKRFMGKHAHMLIHQLSSVFWGTMADFDDEMKNLKKLMKIIKKIYCKHTSVPKASLDKILKHDLWWSAKKCLRLKLVDKIL